MENKKLIQAKVGIILDQPFFATLMMKKQFIEDKTRKTAATDGKVILYNPEYFERLSNEELKGVICHELLHCTLLHHVRREGRDARKWNEAADYALNPLLIDAGMKLPQGALIDSRFSGRSAEEIFKIRGSEEQENEDQNKGNGNDSGSSNEGNNQQSEGMGDVIDAAATTESERAEAEAEAKQELAQAMQIAKQQGKIPASLQRLVEEVLQPKVDWKEVLARFIMEVAHNDYSFSKPNTRYLSSNFILPSLYNVEMGEIVLIVDTSGSVDIELLNHFAGEMQDIVSNFNSTIKVLYVDSEVAGEQEIEPDDVFTLEPKGGGGTDFKPAFTWMEENGIEPAAAIYFTDGFCYSFPKEPDFPLLWAHTGGYEFEPPFGEVINID